MKTLITLFLLFSFTCKAQIHEGINFEKRLNWSQIKEKAKKENKYIFLDTYTTWCAPCKAMENDIFPQKKVGDFFNQNFLNVKVQIDRTKKDNEAIKSWYTDAKEIEKEYKISLFPTYLFLNPKGELVHEIKGGSENAEEFITKASAALDPQKQYSNLKEKFENGNRDTTFLKQIIATANSTHDYNNVRTYIKSYLITQKNLNTPQNINYIASSISTSEDIGYDVILNHPDEVIPVIGEKWRNYILNTIAFDEDILPILRLGGKKEINGPMVNYTGEINKNVDWPAVQMMLNNKYKDRAASLMFNTKTTYYKWTKDWPNLNRTLIEYTKQSEPIEEDIICDWLHYFANFGNQEYFSEALKWANTIKSTTENLMCYKNYGILLYKAGKKDDALKVILAYQESSKDSEKDTIEMIEKMINGLKLD
jgi:thioredoxin-related protein